MKKLFIILAFSICVLLNAQDLRLDIMYTNDMHGGIDRSPATFMNPEFPPMLGGAASAASYIKKVRELSNGSTRDNFLFDAGDFFQGRPIGSLTNGTSVIDYMNKIGYDAMTLGNHEYDISEDKIVATLKNAKFPIISSNIVKKGTENLVDYVRPYIIVKKMGVKIGIIGLTTTDTKLMSFPENIKNIDFLNEKLALQKYVPILRNVEKVDIVIVLMHAGVPYDADKDYEARYGKNAIPQKRYWGYDAQELAHEVPGIDVAFGGHIHKGLAKPWVDPLNHTLVFTNYAYGSNIGHVILKIDPKSKTISGYDTPLKDNALITLFEDTYIPDPEIDKSITELQAVVEKGMDDVIGESNVFLSKNSVDAQNSIGNFTVDAMREEVDADFAFINLGGVRAEIPMGFITYRQIFNVMPFDNQVVTMVIDGTMLKKIIEARIVGSRHGMIISGGKVVYSRNRPDYDRITKLEINGKPWQADKIYKVATTDFLLQGNAGLTILTTIPETQVIHNEINLRDAMVNYVKTNSPIKTKIDDRWAREDRSKMTPELQAELNKKK